MEMRPTFVAIDFETANVHRDSACAIGMVRVEAGMIVERSTRLIKPPYRHISFTKVHGIRYQDVAGEPGFAVVWNELAYIRRGISFFAAHNAFFDRSVLRACCSREGVREPGVKFVCTMELARRVWGIFPTRLPDVCSMLGLDLDHHDPLSDAEACARIVLEAIEAGASVSEYHS